MRHLRLFSAATAALLVSSILPASGQDWAKANLAKSPRHGEFVTIKEANGRALQAWVVYPEVKDKAPVVVMIHEIFGLSDWAREMADELAGAGYIVVEPDLLSGFGPVTATAAAHPVSMPDTMPGMNHAALPKITMSINGSESIELTPEQVRELMSRPAFRGMGCDPMNCAEGQKAAQNPMLHTVAMQQQQAPMDHSHMTPQANSGAAFAPASPGGTSAFPDQGSVTRAVSSLNADIVLADLDAAADYGKKLPASNGKTYVAGFCWGGGKTFAFATHRKDLSAAFVFYGPPPPADAMKNITAPVYGFYAGNDARIDATIPQAQTDMKAAGKTYEPVTYDGAGHGFMRAGEAPDASAENSAARQEGFRRLVKLLGGVR